jgi:hypothetical protein
MHDAFDFGSYSVPVEKKRAALAQAKTVLDSLDDIAIQGDR